LTHVLLLGRERRLREMTADMAGIKPGDRVLDVGCGPGNLTLAAKSRTGTGGEVHGIDAAPEMIEVAMGKAAKSGADVDFRVGLIEEIPFEDGYFDVVLSSLMIHHLPDDLKRRGFTEIRRVLKPGGRLLIVDFKPPSNHFMKHILAHILSHRMMKVDVDGYVPMMEQAGFSNIEKGSTQFRLISFIKGEKS
jgi:demethylmenaquinone methyltransferase/2-methoxy-6-polyprenyl-1,4-benzoquinol methylase/phosphoethanolamine N-methyltransferase